MKQFVVLLLLCISPYAVHAQTAQEVGQELGDYIDAVYVDESALPADAFDSIDTENRAGFIYDDTFTISQAQRLIDARVDMLAARGLVRESQWRMVNVDFYVGIIIMREKTFAVGITPRVLVLYEVE